MTTAAPTALTRLPRLVKVGLLTVAPFRNDEGLT
jgi:hypothetical protein